MLSDYEKEILEVIKKYDPEEYRDLTTKCDKTVAEEHLDYLASQFETIEDFEKSYQEKCHKKCLGEEDEQ